MLTVLRALDAVVILPAAEAVPHDLYVRRDRRRRPVRVSVVGHHRPQMLECLIFILHGALQPVLRVQIHDDPALVEAMMASGKIRLYYKRKELFLCLHLQHRRVVIAEVIIGPLPQVGPGRCRDLDLVFPDLVTAGLSCPFHFCCQLHDSLLPYLPDHYDLFFVYYIPLYNRGKQCYILTTTGILRQSLQRLAIHRHTLY